MNNFSKLSIAGREKVRVDFGHLKKGNEGKREMGVCVEGIKEIGDAIQFQLATILHSTTHT